VVALEKAPVDLRGGNTHDSGGLFRFAFDRAEDLRVLVPDAEQHIPGFMQGVQPYPKALFHADPARVTEGRTDPELAEILIGHVSYPGGTGLMSGAVFGRLAGASAAGR
jgi:tricarballylate dehydrogenase